MPGKSTRPATSWSASQGWVRSDNRPVSSTPPESAKEVAAPSSGCPAAVCPSPPTSATRIPEGQYDSRWKAYVGRFST
ncbi:hypothetical protein Kisp01_22370 [Kineosporia sp. NBRC 101677]|nr:hypothetical protein Kisp01_22370 [Kineosporia sp. NBRC 101677]